MTVLARFPPSRPRLIDSYIVREMLAPSAIGLLVFTFVLLIDQIPRLLASSWPAAPTSAPSSASS